jgi:D-glycero-beta-D-manno-heptose 1-phosphate adenylyltransferase
VGVRIEFNQLEALGNDLRSKGRKVVFTNGHFDLLHVGHLRYLQSARSLGDVLVVGVNDDRITTERKGPSRPILPEDERVELLAGLACVGYATIFHEPTASACIAALRPDVYVKGGDYAPGGAALPEAEVVKAYGGEVIILPLVEGRSTTDIVQAIRDGRPVR